MAGSTDIDLVGYVSFYNTYFYEFNAFRRIYCSPDFN